MIIHYLLMKTMQFFDRSDYENTKSLFKQYIMEYVNNAKQDPLFECGVKVYLKLDSRNLKQFFENNKSKISLSTYGCVVSSINFDYLMYITEDVNNDYHGVFFKEVQNELYENEGIFLVNESGLNPLFKYEIFVVKDYVPEKRTKHGMNIILSCPSHKEFDEKNPSFDIQELRQLGKEFAEEIIKSCNEDLQDISSDEEEEIA